jgi:fatty-acyl-CoA synthase
VSFIDRNPVVGLERQTIYFPAQLLFTYEGRTWDYAEFFAEVREQATALHAAGVQPGERVAYLGLNSVSFMRTMFACWWLGVVFVPLNFRLAPREIAGLLEQCTPRVLFVEPGHRETIETMLGYADVASGEMALLLIDDDHAVPAPAPIAGPWVPASAWVRERLAGAAEPAIQGADEDDLAILMFTSGTTGQPKGVELSYGNIWWNSVNVDSLVDTRRGDTNLAVAPLFHIGGLNALTIRVMVRGGHVVVRRTFDPRQALKDIEEYQVNQAFLVPAMLSAMAQADEFADSKLESLRALICAGAPVPTILLRQYQSKGVEVQQAWGLTETAPFATYLPAELTHQRPGSCGVPMPFTQIKVVDPLTGIEVEEAGQTGELWVKGPNVTRRYWNNPAATEAAFTDGWFRSGDIGYRDAEGFLYVVDRLKDMIITGGENVYPAEVERALMEYPGVLDVAVVGVADEQWGESVVAVMSCADGTVPGIEEVREFSASLLARYKLPKRLIITGAVPRNGSGKLDKPAVRLLANKTLEAK